MMNTWLTVPENSDFSIHNIPFGIASAEEGKTFVASILGDHVIDCKALFLLGYLHGQGLHESLLSGPYLNPFISLGKKETSAIRKQIISIFTDKDHPLAAHAAHRSQVLRQVQEVSLHMPVQVPNYSDFYSSIDHATNVGKMFRDPANALLPNWKHMPVAYHGRASSITVSGTPFHRPKGQIKPPDAEQPQFSATRLLDFELEVAFITGRATQMGAQVSTEQAEDYIFGLVLFNDWSARDIQTWEYVPLGPFLAKNFNSTISPWVVTLDALEPFRTPGPIQDPPVLPYLAFSGNHHFDIQLEVYIQPSQGETNLICKSNYKFLYWNLVQQLAHHTVNGCNICVGDMYASGTISGPSPDSFGSMLELTWRGANPIKLKDGSERKFIQDGDTVILRGFGTKDNIRVGFGEASSCVLPAL
jgi:fumarylacetoacetase